MKKYIIPFAIFAALITAYAAAPIVKKHQIESQIAFYEQYQNEQHDLAERSRKRENEYRSLAQQLLVRAEKEEAIQKQHGDRWELADDAKKEYQELLSDFQ